LTPRGSIPLAAQLEHTPMARIAGLLLSKATDGDAGRARATS